MPLNQILSYSAGGLALLLSLIQLAPVRLNPWSAILGWLGRQINKDLLANVDILSRDIKQLKTDVDTIRDESRENHAKDCRVRILRFSDEIYLGQEHSQEHYKQVLTDITHYEKFCAVHPEFENSIAVAAIGQIKDSYNQRLRKHDFLK